MTTLEVKENLLSLTISHNSIKKAVKSFTMSKRYINTMLRATIINILYHRLNLEEKEFATKTFNNVSFKTFKPKSRNQFIREFHTYMAACKDAIEKNYLRDFYLYFIDSFSGDIVENYKFSFCYNDKQTEKNSEIEVNLTKHTCELLETLSDLGRHTKLTTDVQIKVEFTYCQDTPEDYQPPGFRGIDETESLLKKIDKKGNSVMIGTLFTGFHTLKCRGRGDIFNFNVSGVESVINVEEKDITHATEMEPLVEDEIINVENPEPQTVHPNVMTEDLFPIIAINDVSVASNSARSFKNLNETYISQCIEVEDDESDISEFDCPCKLPISLGGWSPDIISCELCKRKYHAPCQGYLDKTFVEGLFHCGCCKDDNESIVNVLGESKRIFRIRYIVGCVYKMSKIPKELQSLFQQTAEDLKKSNVFDENHKLINESMLQLLFKFGHKSPDSSKLIVGD